MEDKPSPRITRKTLLIIIAALGVLLIVYGAVRHFTGFGEGEAWDRYVPNIIIFAALGLFVYNRKLARDEKQAQEAVEAEAHPEEAEADDDKPHWEREKDE